MQKCTPVSTMKIMSKAKVFVMLEEKPGPYYDVELTSSSEWLKRFKNHYSSHNTKVSSESASADVKAAEGILETLDKLILEEDYLPEQISDVDETAVFWKWMPERTR